MTLIAILLALAVERFIGAVDHLRSFSWFNRYWRWLENKLSPRPVWQGPLGVITVLLPPLLLLGLISWGLYLINPALNFLLALVVLLYSLGPADLGHQLKRYLAALAEGDHDTAARELQGFHPAESGPDSLSSILASILIQANDRIFAVLFWFVVLGPIGALLYRLSSELHHSYAEVHGRFGDSVRDLYNLLNWPSARLVALGYALAGSLVEAIEGWRHSEARQLDVNEAVLRESGLGALQFRQLYGDETETGVQDEDVTDWIESVHGLQIRTLIVWLSILGIMTIAGWMS
jgi:membrane protein required for beta-lactamase induction